MPFPSLINSNAINRLNTADYALSNPIINGGFEVWQRPFSTGSTYTGLTAGQYAADRWVYDKAGAVVHDGIRSADVPTISAVMPFSNYSMHLDVTTADAAIAAGDYCVFGQKIEGYIWAPFFGQPCTLGFWVKDTITGIHCVSLQNAGLDRSLVLEYTINAVDTWEYKVLSFTALGTGAGTINTTNGIGAYFNWALSCGSTFQTTAGAIQTGRFYGTSNQVNSTSSTANNFKLWGVTISLGNAVTPYWPRPYGLELDLCQRYYLSISSGTNPVFGIGSGSGGATAGRAVVAFPVAMRIAPTGITSSGSFLFASSANTAVTGLAFNAASPTAIEVVITTASGLTAGQAYTLLGASAGGATLGITGVEL